MLNKLLAFIRRYKMLQPGDHVVCALSGGADSVALVYAMKLLTDKLGITVSAAHFNHCLRGEESDGDEAFVRQFCDRHDIPLPTLLMIMRKLCCCIWCGGPDSKAWAALCR